jgi:short subunit dehydrogenase-like uncharacterized protein
MTMLLKPTVLILGATGQVGRFILEHLKREPDAVHIRVAARRPEQVAAFQQQGRDAVLLDLDGPRTFSSPHRISARRFAARIATPKVSAKTGPLWDNIGSYLLPWA